MKSFSKLVKNELIKMFAQTAYRVLFIVMVVLFMVVPLLSKGLTALVDGLDSFYDIEDDISYYESLVEESEEKLEKDYYEINLNVLKFFDSNGLDYDSWQFSTMYIDYLDFCLSEHIFKYLRDETVTLEEAQESIFGSYVSDITTEIDYRDAYDKLLSERKEYEDLIIESDLSDYYEKMYEDFLEIKKSYDSYIIDLKANKLFNDDYEYEIFSLECALESFEYSLEILNFIKENNVEYNSWEYNSWVASQSLSMGMLSFSAPATEQEFSTDSSYYEKYDDYDAYIENWKSAINDKKEAAMVLKYSVLNDIPTQSVQKSSSKSIYSTTLVSNIELIMYFAVVLAGLIVANEFSSGSARLLFIRPHSRNKILLSKYTAILVIIVALNVINVLISFGFTTMFNGIGDIFAPNLSVKDEIVTESASFLSSFGTIILTNLRLLIAVSLAFMMSTLCKKGALGIIVGILFDVIMSSIYSIIMVISDLSVVKFTPIPYYMMEIFVNNKAEYVISQVYMNNLNVLGNTAYYQLSSQLNIWAGLANFAFWFVICLLAIFIPFKKQEIKN